ncbi:MAG: ankyrin repeat domain-containing protein [Thermoguttaceae bacterium]|jgi:hypothetical protein
MDWNEELSDAARVGNNLRVQEALDHSANLHVRSDEALRDASYSGHTETVALLLNRGASIHACHDLALRFAAHAGHTKTAALLLDRGANIHAANDRALQLAAENGKTETVALLLDRGANIRAANAAALCLAARSGRTASVALLLEHGAITHADCDVTLPSCEKMGYTDTVALLHSFDALAKLAKSGPKEVRPLIFQTAAIAARCQLTAEDIAAFAAKVAERSVNDTELSRLPAGKALDPVQSLLLERHAADQPARLTRNVGIRGYLKASDVADMVRQFADCVLLPQLLLDAGIKQPEQWKKLDEEYPSQLSDILTGLAAKMLLADKRLDQILAMNNEWHIPGNAIPDDLRPLRGGKWQLLINDIETPVTYHDPAGDHHALVIRALSSQDDLNREGTSLKHCVGTGGYGTACLEGKIHILSVQTNEGTPLATAEVTLTGNPHWPLEIKQFRGVNNGRPLAAAEAAFNWFRKELKDNKLQFRTPANGHWGKIKQKNKSSPVLQRVGFEPTQENIDVCLKHYATHLKIKEPLLKSKRDRPGLAEPRSLENGYRWVDAVAPNPLASLADPSLNRDWQSLQHQLRDACGIVKPRHGARQL